MLTIALVGGDGSGKTTIAKGLEKSSSLPIKYLYMGPSILSSNLALPTSVLARMIKIRSLQKAGPETEKVTRASVSSNDFHYKPADRSAIWLAARLLNRLAEASYRHFLSLIYQWRGFIVVYDRHFLFEARPDDGNLTVRNKTLFDRLEYWFFSYCFPKPKLVIFLDAPACVLYNRKKEASVDYLDRRRKAIVEEGKKMANFVSVDADQPAEKVLADVAGRIAEIYSRANQKEN